MKKKYIFLSTIFLILILSGLNSPSSFAAVNPNVRIGLYFKSTAQSQIDISADSGVAFTAYDATQNIYTPVYSSVAGEVITIRKDSYFISNGSKYTSVASNANPAFGPYHIEIKITANTYKDILPIIQSYQQKGVATYPVFTDDGWKIWTGFYTKKTDADIAIPVIRTKLGENSYTVIEQVDTRIYGVNSSGEVKFMFASKKLLRGKSLSELSPCPIIIGNSKYNKYRGEVEFQRQAGSDMTIINILPLEDYLYGVVPNEMGALSNAEALKAQAIASRTYSYKTINKHSANGFNLCSTVDCHVYNGYNSENPITNKVIDETKNMVVTYNGALAETLYFSSSGGRTEAAVNVWGFDIPYLQSVEDKYETGKFSNYNWNKTFTADEISEKLKSKNIGKVTSIEITKNSEAGRPIEIVVKGTLKPEGIVITKDSCRTFLGLSSQFYTITTNADVNIRKSNETVNAPLSQLKIITANGQISSTGAGQQIKIIDANGTDTTVSASPTVYSFVGKGWGHAVGMSQDGAIGYANAGYTYDKILAHYYTGTKIELKN